MEGEVQLNYQESPAGGLVELFIPKKKERTTKFIAPRRNIVTTIKPLLIELTSGTTESGDLPKGKEESAAQRKEPFPI